MKNLFFILSLFLVLLSNAQSKYFELVSKMDGKLLLQGGQKITAWGYGWDSNNPGIEVPAPLLEIEEGDSVTIRFRNLSNEVHTIHLHGLDVNQNNDGVPSTSFTVANGDTAFYSFKANYSGAFLYHCHVTTTLHLTMGMYGMIVVNRKDSTLFDGGIKYDKQYNYITSDVDTNLSPIAPPPFNEIKPNYFMINGMSGSMLSDDSIVINNNENVSIRIANMAYTTTKYIFPANISATVHLSDGRVLTQPFEPDTLEIFSGERYSLIINATNFNIDDYILVEYYNNVTGLLQYTNKIRVVTNKILSVNDKLKNSDNFIYPNPFNDCIWIKKPQIGVYKLYNSNLKLIKQEYLNETKPFIKIDKNNSNGIYFLLSPSGKSYKLIKK